MNWMFLPNAHHETFAVGLLAATLREVPELAEALFGPGTWRFDTERTYLANARQRRADLIASSAQPEERTLVVEAKRWTWFSANPEQIADAVHYPDCGEVWLLLPDAYREAGERRLQAAGRKAGSVITWQQVRQHAIEIARVVDALKGFRLRDLADYLTMFLYSFAGFDSTPSPWEDMNGDITGYREFLDELRWRVCLDSSNQTPKYEGGDWKGVSKTWRYASVWSHVRHAGGEQGWWISMTEYQADNETPRIHVEVALGNDPDQVKSVLIEPSDFLKSAPHRCWVAMDHLIEQLRSTPG